MFKKIIVFLISLLLVLNSTLSNAFAIWQWGVNNPMAVGASILYDGLKGAVTSSVLITPNATQVSKVLASGGAGFALSYAVEQLLGAVDWVLDPENNQIRYTKTTMCTGTCAYSVEYVSGTYNTGAAVCNAYELYLDSSAANIKYGYTSKISYAVDNAYPSSPGYCTGYIYTSSGEIVQSVAHRANYNSNATLEEATLPLETVARKVIENAEADNLDAQFAVLAAANNILSEAEKDDVKAKPIEDELERNAKCPSGIVRNGSCWICDKSKFMPITRATRDAKTAARGKSCEYVTDPVIKATNAVLWRNLINARIQENACWSPVDPNHLIELNNNRNALSRCEN